MRIKHPEWRQSHEGTRYPFADAATLVNAQGVFIPETVFLDAVFYPIGGQERLRLSKIVIDHENATFYIGDRATSELASAGFALLSPPDRLKFVDEYSRPAGLIVSETNRLAVFSGWPAGTHEFATEHTEFVASCCIPLPETGVRGIILEDGTVFTGDVFLVGSDGIILSVEPCTNYQPGCIGDREVAQDAIRIDVVGDPLWKRRTCGDLFDPVRFLEMLTVEARTCRVQCGPSERGDIKITSGHQETEHSVLRIKPVPGGLKIEVAGKSVREVS